MQPVATSEARKVQLVKEIVKQGKPTGTFLSGHEL